MEDSNLTPQSESKSDIGFPEVRRPEKKSKLPLIIAIIVLILFLGGGAFFIFSNSGKIDGEDVEESSIATPTPTIESTPTPTVENIDKSEISISVLNGTAISGLAGKAKTALEKLGYSKVETGNASKKDYETTEVKFASSMTASAKEEILAELNKLFEDVKTVSGSPASGNIEIITGFPKGHTVTPTTKVATATPKPSGTTTPTTTGTVTVTVTPTKTPTPTQLPLSN